MDQHDPAYNKNTTSFGVYANKYFEQRQYELKVEYIASLLLEYEYDKKIATQNPQTLNKFNYAFDLSSIKKRGTQYFRYPYFDAETIFVADASKCKNIGAFINDYRTDIVNYKGQQHRRPNCKIIDVIINGKPRIFITNTKPIYKGEQLLLDYGNEFWKRYHLNKLQADAAKQAEAKVQIQVKKERENYAKQKKKFKRRRKKNKNTINQQQHEINQQKERIHKIKEENKKLRIQNHELEAEKLCNTPEERSMLLGTRNDEEM